MNILSRGLVKTVTLALGLMVCSAQAEEATVKGIDWRYSVVNGAARIDNLNQICTGKLDIPAKIGTYRVAEVGDGEHPITSFHGPTSIMIPANVTRIGTFAFGGNKNIREVSLPPKLRSIPEALFHSCENLSSVRIPVSVKGIGVEAFAECRSLKSVVIPEGVKSIGQVAFRDCSGLTSVTVPASVTNIVRYAFSDCPNLVSVAIPASVVRIGDMAFDKCPKLSCFYTDADNVDRLKSIAVANNLQRVRVEERPAAQMKRKAKGSRAAY